MTWVQIIALYHETFSIDRQLMYNVIIFLTLNHNQFLCVMVEVYSQKDILPEREEGLAIKKGDTFYVLKKVWEEEGEGQWVYIARNSDLTGEIPLHQLGDTKLPKWFKNYNRKKTEAYLERNNISDGDFIIRPVVRGRDGEFAASVKSKGQIHHFKLSTSRDSDTWTVNGHTVKSLQEFVKKFQETQLVSGKKEKVSLSKEADTEVVRVIDPDYDEYGGDYYDGGYDDGEDYYSEAT